MTERIDGIVLLNKDPGITSFRSLNHLKKIFSTKKIGHTGTLDKFAEGLIIVLVGKFTKLAQYFTNLDKEYIAVFEFGTETDTIDPEGNITAKNCNIPDIDDIRNVISKFKGKIKQIPPDFSAVHINGKRAYKIALNGEKPDIQPRDIEIYDIEILSYKKPELKLKVNCSKGTYIRSLARDISAELNTKAYVKDLKRTKVGDFSLNKAQRNSDISKGSIITGKECFSNIDKIKIVNLKAEYKALLLKGNRILNKYFTEQIEENGLYAVFNNEDFIALISYNDGDFSYKFVIPS